MANNKRNEIINSAVNLIIKKGYFNTSVLDITKGAQISKGSFYTYFESKDSIILEMIQKRFEEITFEQEIIMKASLSFENALRHLITLRMNFRYENIKIELVFLNLIRNTDILNTELKKELEKIDKENMVFIENLLNKFSGEINIEKKYINKYSQLINSIIKDLKKYRFISLEEKMEGEDDIEKMYDEDLENDIEFIYNVVLKILR